MKIFKLLLVLLGLALPAFAFAVQISVPSAPGAGYALISTSTGNYLATSTPYFANATIGNLLVGSCSGTGCGSGSAATFPFVAVSYGNATSTTLGFLNGFTSPASSTVAGPFHLGLSAGGLGIDSSGLVYSGATSTLSTISGTLGVAKGGTGQTSFLQGWLAINDTGAFISSTSPTVAWLTSTSTATSTFGGGINISGSDCFAVAGICLQTFIQNATAYKQAVNYATAAVLPGTPTYSNGSSGVGATLTEIGFGALSIDGQAVSLGQRILVKNQADQTQNGIYAVSAIGSVIANYILTRSTDYNTTLDIYAGTTVPVLAGGTVNGDSQWTESTTGTITVGSSNIVFIETSIGTSADTFAWPFTVNTGYNSTTSPLGLFASTTIGSGTQTTGLTISGGATTTGTLVLKPLGVAAGAFLAIDPLGRVISTTTPSGGSGCTLGGTSDTQIIFNNAGNCGGSSTFTWNNASTLLTVGTSGAGNARVEASSDSGINIFNNSFAAVELPNNGVSTFNYGILTSAVSSNSDLSLSSNQSVQLTTGTDFFFVGGTHYGFSQDYPATQSNGAAFPAFFYTNSLSADRIFTFPDIAGSFLIGSSTLPSGNIGLGSSTPWGLLSLVSGNNPPLVVASSTGLGSTNPLFEIDKNGHVIVGGSTPSVSSCGASPTVRANSSDTAGIIKVGTGVVNACTLTFQTTYTTNAPVCFLNLSLTTATATVLVASTSLSSFVVHASANGLGGSILQYNCIGISPQ